MAASQPLTPKGVPALKTVQEIGDIKFSRKGIDAAVAAFNDLPLQLPENGSYLFKVEAGSLHIYETTSGVSKYKATDPDRVTDTEMVEEGLKLSLSSGSVRSVVIHTKKGDADPGAVTAKAVPALPFLEEFERLSRKKYDDQDDQQLATDRARMAELVRKIQEAYQKPPESPKAAQKKKKDDEEAVLPPKPARTQPATPPSSSSSGYGAGGRSSLYTQYSRSPG